MTRVIVAAPPIPGEVIPLLRIARGLASRGHEITVLTGSSFRDMVEREGLSFTPLTGAADYDFVPMMSAPERVALPPGPPQLNYDLIHAFIDPMRDELESLQELLRADPDQYLVANAVFLGAWPVHQGAPGLRSPRWLTVSAVPLALGSEDTTFFGPVPVGPGEDGKAANRAANAGFAAAMEPARARVNEILTDMGADAMPAPVLDAIYTLSDATAVPTVPGFEFERGDLPDSVRLVGILPSPVADDWEPPTWWGELDGSRPVVVVTQGTIANRDLSQLIEPTLLGLADRDVTVVAALGRDPGELSVPVPANAARVAYHRLGIDVKTATPTPQAVREAVDGLLEDTEVLENVTRHAKVYTEHDALGTIENLLLG